MKVAGFVLTGGRSSRMGRDKAVLPIVGRPLAEHVANTLAGVAEEVFLIGHPERYAHLPYRCLPDLHPDLGPISGLETALASNLAPLNLVVGCDMANLRQEWFQTLLAEVRDEARCVVVEDAAGQWQPLCAVYRTDCLNIVRKAVQERRLRLMDLLQDLNARTVRIEVRILNLNTPEEYDKVVHGNGPEQPLY